MFKQFLFLSLLLSMSFWRASAKSDECNDLSYESDLATLEVCAENGNDSAQYYMGLKYNRGVGVEVDNNKAAYWFLKVAQKGYANAQYAMGLMYYEFEIDFDPSEMVRWFNLAAAQGHKDAQLLLGDMYRSGQRIPVDYPLS